MLQSILRGAWLSVRILLVSAVCFLLAASVVFSPLGGAAAYYLLDSTLGRHKTEWIFHVARGIHVRTFHGVDCHMAFKPCENWPDSDELKLLLASDSGTVLDLKELALSLDVIASETKCEGKVMLYVAHPGTNDIRPIGDLIRRLEEESGMDIPCILRNL